MACVPPEELVGYGTLLQYKNPLTDEWVTVAGTQDLEAPERTREAIETTDNQTGGWRTRIPNPLKSLEPVSYEMKFLSSQWFVLHNMFEDALLADWRLVLMDRRQFYMQFCAFITNMGEDIPMEELVMSTIELTPSGGVTAGYLN
jgi:predicted secreted protein